MPIKTIIALSAALLLAGCGDRLTAAMAMGEGAAARVAVETDATLCGVYSAEARARLAANYAEIADAKPSTEGMRRNLVCPQP